MVDEVDLQMVESERDDVIRIAVKLADALNDINNDIGEMKEVKTRVQPIEHLISQYSGMGEFV